MPEVEITKLLVAIVDRGKGADLVEIYREHRLPFDYLCMGMGTASSRLLDYFGLAQTQKDVVLTFVPARRVQRVMQAVDARFDLSNPGRGILFSCPLSSVSGQVPQMLNNGEKPLEEEVYVETPSSYDLIVAVVNRGDTDPVMDAARSVGARGGTVVHGRRIGVDDAETRLGFSLEPEKDVIAIVVNHAQKLDIMRAINKAAGLATPSRGILFSLPVEDMMGLQAVLGEAASQDDEPADLSK